MEIMSMDDGAIPPMFTFPGVCSVCMLGTTDTYSTVPCN